MVGLLQEPEELPRLRIQGLGFEAAYTILISDEAETLTLAGAHARGV